MSEDVWIRACGIATYVALVAFALSWCWTIRTNLRINNLATIFSSLVLCIFAVLVPIIGINMLHSLWMIPVGMLSGTIVMAVAIRIPFLMSLFRLIASIHMQFLRLGVPREQIMLAEIENQARIEALVDRVTQMRNTGINSKADPRTEPPPHEHLVSQTIADASPTLNGEGKRSGSVVMGSDGRSTVLLGAASDSTTLLMSSLIVFSNSLKPPQKQAFSAWAGMDQGVWTDHHRQHFALAYMHFLHEAKSTGSAAIPSALNGVLAMLPDNKLPPLPRPLTNDIREIMLSLVRRKPQ